MSAKPHSHFSVAAVALFLGGLCWVAAFWLPVFETEQRTIAGYWVFVSGWMGFTIFQFAWYANLLLLMAVLLMYTAPIRATLLAAFGLLVATQAFWFDMLPGAAGSLRITGQGAGFWCWYAGIFLMSIGVFFSSDSDEANEQVTEHPVIQAATLAAPQAELPAEVSAGNVAEINSATVTVDQMTSTAPSPSTIVPKQPEPVDARSEPLTESTETLNMSAFIKPNQSSSSS